MDLNRLPLTKHKIRDDLSTYIFLNYCSAFEPKARKKLKALSKTVLKENRLSYPVQADFIEYQLKGKVEIEKSFAPESSASLAHGITGQILRYLMSPLTKVNIKRIEKLIDELEKISYHKNDCIFWPSHFTNQTGTVVAIGLSLHRGMGGVISVLSMCFKSGIKIEKTMELLEGAVNQLLLIDKATGKKGLPVHWGTKDLPSYSQNSLYSGDPGIGYAIMVAGLRCGKKSWVLEGERILRRGLKKSPLKGGIDDPTFGSGASGISHLSFKAFQLTQDKFYLKESKKWLKIADTLYEKKFRAFEESVEKTKTTQERIRLGKRPEATPACIHNSGLGLYLVRWVQEGLIDSRWDSMYGLTNPQSGEIL